MSKIDLSVSETITKEQAMQALRRSGYLLESRVSALLRDRDWMVESNSAYLDPATGVSREMDVHAIGGSSIYDNDQGMAFIFQHLIIDCVHPSQPVIFIKSDSLLNEKKVELIRLVSEPKAIWDGKYWHQIPTFFGLQDFHHYTTTPIATQFCSFSRKSAKPQEWKAEHEASQYGAFVALGQAIEFHLNQRRGGRNRRTKAPKRKFDPFLQFFYPVMVVEGEIWSIDQTQDTPVPETVDRINYKHSTFVNGSFEEYIVAVVTERALPAFINQMEDECTKIASQIRSQIEIVGDSHERIEAMDDVQFSRLPVTVSFHVERILAAKIITRERGALGDVPSSDE